MNPLAAAHEQLRAAATNAPFAFYGLRRPLLAPRFLAGGNIGGPSTVIVLGHGDPWHESGPLVNVGSSIAEHKGLPERLVRSRLVLTLASLLHPRGPVETLDLVRAELRAQQWGPIAVPLDKGELAGAALLVPNGAVFHGRHEEVVITIEARAVGFEQIELERILDPARYAIGLAELPDRPSESSDDQA
jgi:hypothetical protein